ncbi:hypothetical protein CcaCcLH18_14081 [Colletotrichum camelliae]|nr:hypothetical protein CcaCcLH18_14081 [Colletotrichum camelliae]
MRKVFSSVMELGPFDSDQLELQWWDQLPAVPAVTGLLLRQQNRRRWKPPSLAHMFARFPRLQELHYEPWREWDYLQHTTDRREYCHTTTLLFKSLLALIWWCTYAFTDIYILCLEYQYLFESIRRSNNSLKRLVVFENFNQQYPVFRQRFHNGVDLAGCDSIRKPALAVSQMVALASLKLEHLAASFIIDASSFFEIQPAWEWPNLTSLTLTSRLLTPDENSDEIEAMLRAAAAAAMRMPRLETMEIWNGRKGLAALFRYQACRNNPQAVILWRGTWKLAMQPSVIQAWEAVMHQYNGWRLDVVQEQLDEAGIKSHGDAVCHLMLASQVIRPVSLQQIQIEQEALQGVVTI